MSQQTQPPSEEENEGKATVEVRCIDCAKAALGNYRCQEYEGFASEDFIFDCDCCDIRRCEDFHHNEYPAERLLVVATYTSASLSHELQFPDGMVETLQEHNPEPSLRVS